MRLHVIAGDGHIHSPVYTGHERRPGRGGALYLVAFKCRCGHVWNELLAEDKAAAVTRECGTSILQVPEVAS